VEEEVVILPSKLQYVDLRVGGGPSPQPGDLVVVDIVGRAVEQDSTGENTGNYGPPFIDTFTLKRPIAFVFGRRPLAPSICPGVEEALQSMHVGGKRKVVVPPDLGFGASGNLLGNGISVPANATLEYTLQLLRASIAPS
jgi:FKBP-type peptidyl-prolyl cis-trans isomerase